MALTFRSVFRFLVPGWLQTGQGEIVQWLEGLMLDAFTEAANQSAYLMLPSRAPSDALNKIGADRAIPRGFSEPEASYRERLRRWRWPRGHRIRGSAPGLLEQIAAVFGNAVDTLQTIDARCTRYTWSDPPTGAERGVAWNWDGSEGASIGAQWARFWIVVKPTGASILPTWDAAEAAGTTWDSALAADTCWAGLGIRPGQIAAIARLARVGRLSWTPGGRRPVYLVVQRDGEAYPVPDGTWGEWEDRPAYTYAFEPLHVAYD